MAASLREKTNIVEGKQFFMLHNPLLEGVFHHTPSEVTIARSGRIADMTHLGTSASLRSRDAEQILTSAVLSGLVIASVLMSVGWKQCPKLGEITTRPRANLTPCTFECWTLEIGGDSVMPEAPGGSLDAFAVMKRRLLIREIKIAVELVKVVFVLIVR